MTSGRIQDPEGAKTFVISFKTAAGAILAVHRQTYKIVSFRDINSGRLRVDTAATTGGKQDMNKQGRRVILIYKAHMYKEATLDPERCSHKSDEKARRIWLQTHLRRIDLYEDVNSPERDQQEDDTMEEADADTGQPPTTELPPSGSGAQATARGTARRAEAGGTANAGVTAADASARGGTLPEGVTRLMFGTPEPPTLPIRPGGGTSTGNISVEHQNRFAPLRQQGATSGEQGSLNISSGILRGGSSTASSSNGSRGRDPIPLTPEILQLLDRLEPDKGKHARLLTEHLTGQRTLPSTEQDLQKLLDRKA
jgi:hypothetical protein